MKNRFFCIKTLNKAGDMPFATYLLFAAAYLGIQMFQGLSFLDIGFYMSGYQHFNSEPTVSYYLGQWLMTFVTTSAICKALAINSYMGLRVMHLIFVLLSQTIIYLYLKQYIKRRYIILGLLLATLSHFGSYTEINYNDYSIGLLTLSLLAYHHGIMRGKPLFVILGGVCTGAAFFFRLTNLTFIGIPLFSILISRRWAAGMSALRQSAYFLTGVIAGCLATITIIHLAGMTDILLMTVSDIAGISRSSGDPHNLANITINFYSIVKEELKGGALTVVITAMTMLATVKARRFRKPLLMLLALIMMINVYYWEPSANITVGICIAALAAVFTDKTTGKETAYLFLLSLYIPIVFPLGSNAQVEFFGKDVCFLSLPLSLSLICNAGRRLRHDIRGAYTKSLAVIYISVCAAFVFTNIKRPMMEEGNRLQCRHTIDSPLTRGILTTKENADMHNYLIKCLKPVIPRNSYMICDFSIPVIGMLECKPYAVFSTVFTSNSMNRHYIGVAYRHTGKLPYLLTDKQKDNDKDRYVEQCLNDITPYRVVWQDERFALKAPKDTGK